MGPGRQEYACIKLLNDKKPYKELIKFHRKPPGPTAQGVFCFGNLAEGAGQND